MSMSSKMSVTNGWKTYQKWYRPDNMALIVVGDVDTNVIKTLIEKKLNHSKKNTPLIHPDYRIPFEKRLAVRNFIWSGNTYCDDQLSFLQDSFPEDTVEKDIEKIYSAAVDKINQFKITTMGTNTKCGGLLQIFIKTISVNQHCKPYTLCNCQNRIIKTPLMPYSNLLYNLIHRDFNKRIQCRNSTPKKLDQKQLNIQAGSLKLANDFIPFICQSIGNSQPRPKISPEYPNFIQYYLGRSESIHQKTHVIGQQIVTCATPPSQSFRFQYKGSRKTMANTTTVRIIKS